MWVGDESKGDGEYDNNWDFSLYSADNISLGTNPQMSVNIWYSTEFSWDGGNVQISNDVVKIGKLLSLMVDIQMMLLSD